MHKIYGLMPAFFLIFINVFFVDLARALSVTYSYEGSNFVEFDGEPEVFSTGDKVIAQFTLDCAVAHAEGNCRNLPNADYVELGAVQLEPLGFSAGPAGLPTADGNVDIVLFFFSTDSNANIVEWDMDLGLPDPSGFINVDTDNQGDGLDSAAALGGGAVVVGQPGNWENDLPVFDGDFDILVRKSVDNPSPSGPLQTVEFTIEVSNIGDGPANNVVVKDKLPPELAIPEGMSAFTSAGYYDPSSGQWEVGTIEPGLAPAILTIPVVITTGTQPVCVLNTANSDVPGDINTTNNASSSALRRSDIERCVDLGVEVTDWYTVVNPCEGTGGFTYILRISNAGPDEARLVILDISETLYKAPGFSIDERNTNCDGLRCTWAALGVGQNELVLISTEMFQIPEPTEHRIQAVVSSDVEDYKPENNTLVDQHTIEPFREVSCTGGGGGMDFGGAGGVGGGCFIATAVYGSKSHHDVLILRDFRDNVLLDYEWGKALVDSYYLYSPNLACYIEEREGLRLVVRGILKPTVLAIAHPWKALLSMVAALGLLVFLLVSRRHRSVKGKSIDA